MKKVFAFLVVCLLTLPVMAQQDGITAVVANSKEDIERHEDGSSTVHMTLDDATPEQVQHIMNVMGRYKEVKSAEFDVNTGEGTITTMPGFAAFRLMKYLDAAGVTHITINGENMTVREYYSRRQQRAQEEK